MALPVNIFDPAVLLAGYLMAHSAFNLSFVDEVKTLTPMSLCAKDGKLSPKFHTGTTQADAVSAAKLELSTNQAQCDSWAFAREGVMQEDGHDVHTLAVSSWSSGMKEPVDFVQRFERAPRFKLVGEPLAASGGVILIGPQSEQMIVLLRKGIAKHPDGGNRWDAWH
jgi:hypothetical protein